MKKPKSKLFLTLSSIAIFISIFLIGFTTWMVGNFGDVSFEQYYFGITAPTAGTPTSFYVKIGFYLLLIVVVTVVIALIYHFILKKMSGKMFIKKVVLSVITVSFLVFSVLMTNTKLKISGYVFAEDTPFFEENYVEPTTDIVKFPEKKKNLIFIYLESFETTYWSKELGGAVDYNLIPNLTNLIEEPGSVNFSNSDKYGGPWQAPETGYSIAGMYATQSGLPFKVPVNGNDYGTQYKFATGTITLGDILAKEGYNMEFLVGADGRFAGVNNFYQTHGDWNILDHTVAIEEGRIPADYKEWWGFEDSKLFEYSKEKLEKVSKEDKPFAMVIEADDTHFPDGYLDKSCPTPYSEPYENSISCEDQMVIDFINYVKQQDYYKDTVIVIHGDHLSMEQKYFENNIDPDYWRTTFNAYVNVDQNLINQANTKNRKMATMDVFPTTLAAMGVEVKGDRLGIGTNLFSHTPTIYEFYGWEKVNEELSKKSEWFFEKFLFSENKYE